MTTITYSDTLQVIECGNCHISFAIPVAMYRQVKADGSLFSCPAGCKIGYSDTDVARLRAKLDQAEADAAWQRKCREAAEAEARHQAAVARGYKGAAAKAKARAAKGVCPAPGCKRSFVNVARHVASCHPDLMREVES